MLNITTMISKIPLPDLTYCELKALIAKCITFESHKYIHTYIHVEYWSKKQRSPFLEISFEFALTLSQQ